MYSSTVGKCLPLGVVAYSLSEGNGFQHCREMPPFGRARVGSHSLPVQNIFFPPLYGKPTEKKVHTGRGNGCSLLGIEGVLCKYSNLTSPVQDG